MNILNISNITESPSDLLWHKINSAIDEVEEDLNTTFSVDFKESVHAYFDEMIEDFEENGQVKDALSFVDNLLVNHDYYATVKELADEEVKK